MEIAGCRILLHVCVYLCRFAFGLFWSSDRLSEPTSSGIVRQIPVSNDAVLCPECEWKQCLSLSESRLLRLAIQHWFPLPQCSLVYVSAA